MARYNWLVYSNCTPGQDDAFNEWYDEIHLPDLLRIPGIVGAHRFDLAKPQLAVLEDGEMELCDAERIGARFGYLAVYEFNTDDPAGVIEEVRTRANTPLMELSPYLDEVYTVLYEHR